MIGLNKIRIPQLNHMNNKMLVRGRGSHNLHCLFVCMDRESIKRKQVVLCLFVEYLLEVTVTSAIGCMRGVALLWENVFTLF